MLVDYTKPIEYVDGSPATYNGRSGYDRYACVSPKGEVCSVGGNHYLPDGTHAYNLYDSVRNVAPVTDKALAAKFRKLNTEINEALTELNQRGYEVEDANGDGLVICPDPIVMYKYEQIKKDI